MVKYECDSCNRNDERVSTPCILKMHRLMFRLRLEKMRLLACLNVSVNDKDTLYEFHSP